MKILYHHRIASKDGQYVHIEEIIRALEAEGHEIVLAAPEAINRKQFGESSNFIKSIRTILPGFMHELMEFMYGVLDYFKLKKKIKLHKPDCIYERYNLFFPSGIWAKKKFNIPLILEVNAPLYEERKQHDHIGFDWLADWSERFVWNNADYVLPVTEVLADKVRAKGVPAENVVVIPNGINREQFSTIQDSREAKQSLGFDGKLILGFTGFAREWHGLDRVLDVMASNQMEDWLFLIVGDGPVRQSLEEKASRLGISDSIHFTGIVDRGRIPDYVSCFDIALQPDVVAYASPLKLFEYLALGKPVLAPSRPNIREVLSDGVNAMLFDAEDDEDFCAKLKQLCQSETQRDELGDAGRNLIHERGYYWDHNATKIIQLFGLVFKQSGRGDVEKCA